MDEEVNIHKLINIYTEIRQKKEVWYKFSEFDTNALNQIKKAARLCNVLQADPEVYLKAQDKYKIGSVLHINQIATKNAERNYRNYVEHFYNDKDLEKSFNAQLTYLLTAIKGGRHIEQVLQDDMIDFEPWFRIVITKEPNAEIIDKYKDQAKAGLTKKLFDFLIYRKLDVIRIHGN